MVKIPLFIGFQLPPKVMQDFATIHRSTHMNLGIFCDTNHRKLGMYDGDNTGGIANHIDVSLGFELD